MEIKIIKINKIVILPLMLSVILISGCIPSEQEGAKEQTTIKISVQENIQSIVNSFDANNPDSFNSVEEIVDMGEPAIPDLLEMLKSDDLYNRWAAVYSLVRIGHSTDREKQKEISSNLKKIFNDSNPTVRTLAAGGSVSLGKPDGIPILIESLKSDDVMVFNDPPELLRHYSIKTLRTYTQQNFGYDPEKSIQENSNPIEKWENWWQKNKNSLEWDEGNKVFVIKNE